MDSYSAFEEADHRPPPAWPATCKQRRHQTVFVTGLATDFCVAWTAMDARKAGFDTYVIEDATRAIDLERIARGGVEADAGKGVKRIQSADILGV